MDLVVSVALGTGSVRARPLLVFLEMGRKGTWSVTLVLRNDVVPDFGDLIISTVFPVQRVSCHRCRRSLDGHVSMLGSVGWHSAALPSMMLVM